MATINKKFYNNETEYSDGSSIENEILDMVKNTDDLESILINDSRWPVFYHLSHLRENLLNWYPFNEDANLLEIGACCGALTGLFCNKVSKVTAVELTDRRSQIIYNRHKIIQILKFTLETSIIWNSMKNLIISFYAAFLNMLHNLHQQIIPMLIF